jgi:hypothetical protein
VQDAIHASKVYNVGVPAVIVGNILTHVYPVKSVSHTSPHAAPAALETRLHQWYTELPEYLRYDSSGSQRIIPPPHILLLHIRYWSAVLLLHRALYV